MMPQPYDMSLKELEAYKPQLTKQPDFDSFWEQSLADLKQVSPQVEMEPQAYPVKGLKLFKVKFRGFNDAPIGGMLAYPEGGEALPGLVMYHGYNWCADGSVHDVVNMAQKGYAVLVMFTRGQYGESEDNVVTEGHHSGWMSKGVLDPERYYYRAVYMDAVRALEVLASMEEVDSERIGVIGGSQGGALSLAAAALSTIPKVCVADYPYLSNFERAIDISPRGPYLELNEYFRRNPQPEIEEQAKKTLSYFDIMNLAPRVQCHSLLSVGLVDDITPPSTIFAAYNHLQCAKDMKVYRYFGHEFIPGHVRPKLETLMKYLQD